MVISTYNHDSDTAEETRDLLFFLRIAYKYAAFIMILRLKFLGTSPEMPQCTNDRNFLF